MQHCIILYCFFEEVISKTRASGFIRFPNAFAFIWRFAAINVKIRGNAKCVAGFEKQKKKHKTKQKENYTF